MNEFVVRFCLENRESGKTFGDKISLVSDSPNSACSHIMDMFARHRRLRLLYITSCSQLQTE